MSYLTENLEASVDVSQLPMHEMGHIIGIGYADDSPIEYYGIGVPRGFEV